MGTWFLIMFSMASALAIVTLAYVIKHAFSDPGGEIGGWELRGARQRIAAVMRQTLAEGLRAKVAGGFALLILVSIPVFWLTAEGDGTIKGRVQMFIAYSLGFTGFILALLTILFSCRSLAAEISGRQIFAVVSKPIPRWQILAGKWLGVMTLNAVLLLLATVMTYAGTRWIVEGFKSSLRHDLETYGSITPTQASSLVQALGRVSGVGAQGIESPIVAAFAEELGVSREQVGEMLLKLPEPTRVNLRRFDELRRQVLVSRAEIPVTVPDMSEDVDAAYAQLKEENRLPEGWSEQRVRDEIRKQLAGRFCNVGPFERREWTLQGPPPESGRQWVMSVRFKTRVGIEPLAAQFQGRTLETDTLWLVWAFGDPGKAANFVETNDTYPINTFWEVEVPQQGVGKDGTFYLSVQNIDPRRVAAIFDLPAGNLEVLYRVGSYELGLCQAGLAMLIPLACLAAFGVCASTFLSFPVGSLIVVTLYIISASMGFVAESLATTADYAPPEHEQTAEYQLRRVTVAALGWVLAIGDVDPVQHVTEGRYIGWALLGTNCLKFVIIKGLVVMLIAVLIFRRRELAAVIV